MRAILLCVCAALTAVDTSTDFDKQVAAIKKKLPGDGFTIVVQPPFVVVGDEPADLVKQRADHTVKWAVDSLKRDFFVKDPTEVITIWLFKNDASYTKNARKLFGDTPDTPYGYYLPSSKAMVMNIGTGSGTLVHEIVHPFMRANFPDCPAWFNEGMGSMFEQSGERDGHIIGYTNWRLPGLQKAIEAGTLQSFEKLTATDDDAFYGDARGTNYAQARYLLYYLQENGLLRTYYREFLANHKSDPTGVKTLKKVLKTDDLGAFKKSWEKYVRGLRYPN